MEYSVDYLENITVPKLQKWKPSLSKQASLDILAKAMLFKDFSCLRECYQISTNQRLFDTNNIVDDYCPNLNIAESGFLFSEYVLAYELNLEESEALNLKKKIDLTWQLNDHNFNGNIFETSLERVQYGLSKVVGVPKERMVFRIMSDWPFSFYASMRKGVITYKSGTRVEEEFLCFDGFTPQSLEYYMNESNLYTYIRRLMSCFLAWKNIIFLDNVIETTPLPLLQVVMDRFEHHHVSLSNFFGRGNSIFFPQIKNPIKKYGLDGNFGEAIKALRIKKKLTQSELADKIDLSIKQIYNIEAGKSDPKFKTICKVIVFFENYDFDQSTIHLSDNAS